MKEKEKKKKKDWSWSILVVGYRETSRLVKLAPQTDRQFLYFLDI